jgi:hypothetical protein
VGYWKPCDRDHRAAPEAPARPRPALELELSLLDHHDGIGKTTRHKREFEPGRNSNDAPGEARGKGAAKERAGSALVRGSSERVGETEGREELGVEEEVHVGDESGLDPDYVDRRWSRVGTVAVIDTEGWLSVRARRHEPTRF